MPPGTPNTKRLKPLSPYAWGKLLELSYGPLVGYNLNPGVRLRLRREGLVEDVGDGGCSVRITPKGQEVLAAWVERTRASGKELPVVVRRGK